MTSEGKALAGHTVEAGHADADRAVSDPGELGATEVSELREGKAVAADALEAPDDDQESNIVAAAAETELKGAEERDEGTMATPPQPEVAEGAAMVQVAAVASVVARPAQILTYRRRRAAGKAGAVGGARGPQKNRRWRKRHYRRWKVAQDAPWKKAWKKKCQWRKKPDESRLKKYGQQTRERKRL